MVVEPPVTHVSVIEERLTSALMDSGMVERVSMVHVSSIRHDLHITPAARAMVDERILRLFLHWTGEQRREVWVPRPFENPWFVEEVTSRQITISVRGVSWTGGTIAQHETLARLLVLALSLAPPTYAPSPVELDLLHLYQDRHAVESACMSWVTRVLLHEQDGFTSSCPKGLRPYWLCCEKHRVLLLERQVLRDWLIHFFSRFHPRFDYDDYNTTYMPGIPSLVDVRALLASALRHYESPRDYLQAHFSFKAEMEEHRWDRPTRDCTWGKHMRLKCCSIHVAFSALYRLFEAWSQYYNDELHLSREHCTRAGFFDLHHLALFLDAAGIAPADIRFPRWFRDVAEVDIRRGMQS